MKRCLLLVPALLMIGNVGYSQSAPASSPKGPAPLKFVKQQIATESYESVAVFDVNNDKILDLVSGAFWYEGPRYFQRHYIGPVKQFAEYWDDFSTIPFDVNGDGRMDFITGGWFGKSLVWKENPGKDTEWKEHVIATPGNIETTRSWDIDGDGVPEIVPNTPNDPLIVYRHIKGTDQFSAHKILDKSGHGLGFGDINGDGRGDLIIPGGWIEAPAAPFRDAWKFHPEFNLGTASVPIIVTDVNKDGLADLIVGQGHDYGLDWYEQKADKKTGKRSWIKHAIDPYNSQFHTMQWVDLDGDGSEELLTGKRYRAHNHNDPGSNDPSGVYYYKWNGESFTKQVISYGQPGEGKGAGIYFDVQDLTGSGRKDVIVAGKDGLFIFFNKGSE
ncbi:VCBS repeat-containing protein [Chitinophaga sp. MM2321]|uniref:FG-GAP repeat domain-containing protein n=1 Tax=Chitinophaga sp. MM2321 TaxID=3137178 RepID=UPI0032D5AE16